MGGSSFYDSIVLKDYGPLGFYAEQIGGLDRGEVRLVRGDPPPLHAIADVAQHLLCCPGTGFAEKRYALR